MVIHGKIFRFAIRLGTRKEHSPRSVKETGRWLFQPAAIPITAIRGEIREYLLSDILRAIAVGDQPTVVAHVQATFDTLAVRFRPTDRAGLPCIPFGDEFDLDPFGFGLVVKQRGETVELPP